jgi:hypothetical protein
MDENGGWFDHDFYVTKNIVEINGLDFWIQ